MGGDDASRRKILLASLAGLAALRVDEKPRPWDPRKVHRPDPVAVKKLVVQLLMEEVSGFPLGQGGPLARPGADRGLFLVLQLVVREPPVLHRRPADGEHSLALDDVAFFGRRRGSAVLRRGYLDGLGRFGGRLELSDSTKAEVEDDAR